MKPVEPVVLTGSGVRLEPVAEAHRDGLRAAAADPQIWRYMPAESGTDDGFDRMFAGMLAARTGGTEVPFVVRSPVDDRIVGSSRYMNLIPAHDRLENGSTWFHPDAWGGAVNPACKLLLLGHAFDALGAERVEFKCDARNRRSRNAIAGIGGVEEGTLRCHMLVQDGIRHDTVYFSILRSEWPTVRARLKDRLDALEGVS